MPKHHVLPAAYLGGFSLAETDRLRERPVWVARRSGRPFQRRAEKVAWRADHYTVRAGSVLVGGGDEPSSVIDDLWSGAEAELREVVDRFTRAATTGVVDLGTWLRAVELLAQFFVRTPPYDERQVESMAWLEREGQWGLTPDEINGSRIMNLQRLRPALLHGAWVVQRAPAGNLVTNDCGYTPVNHVETGNGGYVFPLRRDLAVLIFRGPVDQAFIQHGDWIGVEVHRAADLSDTEVTSLNEVTAANRTEIYGPTEGAVALAQAGFRHQVAQLGPDLLIPSPQWLREHEMDWFELAELAGLHPSPVRAVYLRAPAYP